ncbi:MAG: glycoside hydrolase family 2 TIM barrel-domain containing protein [Candidatus Pedobacter colombiensis]|uniref:Glycoside hydrolase family 2 TIM barrel-domain containing protein n=1 Tax=Candidatus Pedobacter colombiensis TaxID=3121371 RepID=A0AAJ5WBI0_9SPHI|nr:sugar-binding domain-containing protein [Pedobacter sp.]WEK20414.1 MAG: glycoside hydrolase family 2 TIM barrel-domain containing protein [Pedobacter sp.]
MYKTLKECLMLVAALPVFWAGAAQAQQNYKMQPEAIQSRWAKLVSPANALKEYPRPQMVRAGWTNLNGLWDYAITVKDAAKPAVFEGQILVPYPIESALSGVKKALLPTQNLWYKRNVQVSGLKPGERTLLHFGAVDWQCWVYVNGREVGQHTGGYSEFSFDITDALKAGSNELLLKVFDPTGAGIGPHGKQVLDPQNIYYTPSSGIWQTVWLEVVPEAYVKGLKLTPDIDKGILRLKVDAGEGFQVEAIAWAAGVSTGSVSGSPGSELALPVKNGKLWSPASPFLYDLVVRLKKNGKVVDEVKSYFGMRKISIGKDAAGVDRIFLNNKPYYNLGTLDQGFWPDGLYTAPTDEALAFDIKAIKAMGFNTIRKHIKVEPARWYYHADKLGMLVWQDLVNPNQGLPEGSKAEFERESAAELAQLHNYPSVVCWVLFNEKWGQYDQKRLSNWVKQTDPSRILNGHSGELLYVNEVLRSPSPDAYVDADMTDVHAYPDPMNSVKQPGKAQVCGEFGGIGVFIPDHQWLTGSAWGYIQEKPAGLMAKYKIMNQHLQLFEKQGLSGSIYTQPFDVEGEQNGLMTYDREVIKIPFATLRLIHKALNPDLQVEGAVQELSRRFASLEMTTKNADLTEPGILYSAMLDQYIAGKRDVPFLKKMAMMATQAGDKPGAALAGSAYIAGMKAPLSTEDINSVVAFTKSTKDVGFALMLSQADAFKKVLGERKYTVDMMNMIFKGEMEPMMNEKQSWEAIEARVKPFGAPAEEILLRAKVVAFYNQQDWKAYVPLAKVYLEKYGANLSEQEKGMFQGAVDQHQ